MPDFSLDPLPDAAPASHLPPRGRVLLAVLGSMAAQGPAIQWIARLRSSRVDMPLRRGVLRGQRTEHSHEGSP
jgi:hypothetical protein